MSRMNHAHFRPFGWNHMSLVVKSVWLDNGINWGFKLVKGWKVTELASGQIRGLYV